MATTKKTTSVKMKRQELSPDLVRYRGGQVIFREGERGSNVYLITSGDVQITRSILGEEHVFAILEPGQFFGEMALFGHLRSASATAVTNVQLLRFTRQVFFAKTQLDPTFALALIEDLCNRLRGASDMIHEHLHDEKLDENVMAVLKSMNLALHDSRPDSGKTVRQPPIRKRKAATSRSSKTPRTKKTRK